MYPDELNNNQYWHLLRERFFHGLPVNLRISHWINQGLLGEILMEIRDNTTISNAE